MINDRGRKMEEEVKNKPIVIYGGPLFDGKGNVYKDGAIYVSKKKVKFIGNEEEVFSRIPKNIDMESHDTQGKVIFPGLINLHHHFYSALSKGLSPIGQVTNFYERLSNFWWKLDKALDIETIQLSALITLLDCIKAGTTTIFDHHASPVNIKGSLENISSVVKRAGIQASLCYEVSDRDGNDVFIRGLEENLNFIKSHRDDEEIGGILGLHANFTLSEDSLQEISRNFDPEVGIHIHCGEDVIDAEYCKDLGYEGPVDRLNYFNLLSPKSILAHGIHLSRKELKILEKARAIVVHNPESNMNNNVGRLDIPLPEKVCVGLGTDGMSSNMLQTFRSAYLLHRQAGIEEKTIFKNIPDYLFKNNSLFASQFFSGKPGILEQGSNADISVFNYIPVTPFHSENLYGHIIFGMYNTQASMVMTKGQIIYNDGAFLTLDEELIRSEAKKASERLWKKYVNQ